jgi:hypothetical protein
MTGEAAIQSGGHIMKTVLAFVITSATTTALVPTLAAKLTVGAFVLTGLLTQMARRAPVGYQDEKGFHLIHVRRTATERRRAQLRLWRARKRLVTSWFFPDSRRTAKA